MPRRAFTLVELLVVIAIIGLLSTVATVAMSGSRDKARIASGISFEQSLHNALGSSLAAQYDFEEGSGTVALDSSGNANNAALAGAPTWVTDTYGVGSQYSMNFTGANYVVPAKGLGTTNSNFTIALWIKTTVTGAQMSVVANAGGGDGYRFGLTGGYIYFLIGNGPNNEGGCGLQKANDGKWHHIAGVFSRTSLSFTCYLDGHQIGTLVLASSYPGSQDGAPRIGTTACCTAFVGQLDEVRVYLQDLTLSDINSIYNETKGRFAFTNAAAILPGRSNKDGT